MRTTKVVFVYIRHVLRLRNPSFIEICIKSKVNRFTIFEVSESRHNNTVFNGI